MKLSRLLHSILLAGIFSLPAAVQAAAPLIYEDFQGPLWNPPSFNLYAPNYHPGSSETGFTDTANFTGPVTQSLGNNVIFTAPFAQPLVNGVAQVMIASQYAPGTPGNANPFNASAQHGALSINLYASVTTSFAFFIGDVFNVSPSGPRAHESMYQTIITIPGGVWTTVIMPLDSNPGHWDNFLATIDWTQITQIFIDALGPPCSAPLPLPVTINYGTIQFIDTTSAGPTPAPTTNYNCPTDTPTLTPTTTFTLTSTFTPTFTLSPTFTRTLTFTRTPTLSPTPTLTRTLTFTRTPTRTPTITLTPTVTRTPTITPTPYPFTPGTDIFDVSQNVLEPALGSVSIQVAYGLYPGDYSFRIYNTAGELIKTLDPTAPINAPVIKSYTWDGTNDQGEACASGVYILYLIEPFDRKLKRIYLVR